MNRQEAGQQLAKALKHYSNHPNAIVFGLPRGGLPVAYEVAKELGLPLDVYIVRKLGAPYNPEFAIGAIASHGAEVLNDEAMRLLSIDPQTLAQIVKQEKQELARRELLYRANKPIPDIKDKVVIIIDDGLATGSTMRAAIAAIRQFSPESIVVAVPVAPVDEIQNIHREADEVVCLHTPSHFHSVGAWYHDFSQTTDEEVKSLLRLDPRI